MNNYKEMVVSHNIIVKYKTEWLLLPTPVSCLGHKLAISTDQ